MVKMMTWKRSACTAIMIAVIFLIANNALSLQAPASADKAPDFILQDTNGKTFRLGDYKGKKPVMIIFSTTWCPTCISEVPYFKSLHAIYGKQGLEIVNVDVQESKAKASKFSTRHNLPYRVLTDESGIVSRFYGIRGVPSLVLVDKKGRIVCRECTQIEPYLEAVLKNK
ncbi:MAG: redoxin family protein [Syntrophobacterales bacterium]|nr:redoxin family protein [Syntrophobacterales bacterium]